MEPSSSLTRLVKAPRWSSCSRERRRTRRTMGRTMSTSSGAETRATTVSRHDKPTRIATYTTIRLTFWTRDASAAGTTVFTWAGSLGSAPSSAPPRRAPRVRSRDVVLKAEPAREDKPHAARRGAGGPPGEPRSDEHREQVLD